MKTFTFNAEEIFEEIPGDSENVLMKMPPEILESTGWKEGDTLNIKLEDGGILIEKV
jgi:antitoxin component of MazEF toxin-antitoxin module